MKRMMTALLAGAAPMPVTMTINGQMLSAEPGMTVLEAALANDIYIPTLC